MRVVVSFSGLSLERSLQTAISQAVKKSIARIPERVKNKWVKRKTALHVSVLLVGNSKSQELNRAYRKKNRPTDVLSFSRLEAVPFPGGNLEVGDLVICLPVARKQAKLYGLTFKEELQRLTVHGTLHLFSYDHEKSLAEEKKMFRLQEKILSIL